uniref:Carbonic anhydrase n=1 Tax=Dermatophagoides pteronyssinus TaxID=6956 RepID=A0A6P6YK11_DERPT
IILIILLNRKVDTFQKWTYDDQKAWSIDNKECSDHFQSPININHNDLILNDSLKIEFHNYNQPSSNYRVTNHGRSVQFDYIGDSIMVPMITGSALNGKEFALQQFHFHWGLEPKFGSEHRIDNHIYPIEMHLVHYNHDEYQSFSQALQSRNENVAVLAIFFDIQNQNNPDFDVISEKIQHLQTTHTNYSIDLQDRLILQFLLPKNTRNFYRYHGSFTTPPCTTNVTWLVMNQPNEIGFIQYEKFKDVIDHKPGKPIGNNYRQLQQLNGRKIECSFQNHQQQQQQNNNNNGDHSNKSISMIIILVLSIIDLLAFLTISKFYMFK